jgi:beta-lactamase superfamily II metal-dependent hydrolase
MIKTLAAAAYSCLVFSLTAFGQANGKLQIHFMDVGQGDGAVLISPQGQVVLFDVGKDMKRKDCTKVVSYLDGLQIKKVDYLFVSHYHFDHIGCIPDALEQFPLQHEAYDRGQSYPGATYTAYVTAVNSHRTTAVAGTTLELDKGSGHSVLITVEAVNGNGVSTTNENDLSLTAVVSYGGFKTEIGGDLSGDNTGMYADIETSVAPKVGHIDVYKVHHHCSSHSTNEAWLVDTSPTIGIISTGDNNAYQHPTADCLERLHQAGIKTYWTEHGNGAAPEPDFDDVAGNIVVEVAPGAATYSVSSGNQHLATYSIAGGVAPGAVAPSPVSTPAGTGETYAWSKNSNVYHHAECKYVQTINSQNLVTGNKGPAGKTLHKNCPLH